MEQGREKKGRCGMKEEGRGGDKCGGEKRRRWEIGKRGGGD